MIAPDQVSAVLVTRGDIDLSPIVKTLPFEVVVWNNGERFDHQCYGRFAAIPETTTPHIYVQDDDLTIDALELLAEYHGDGIVANVPPDEEWRFIGGGAFFPRDLPAFDFYWDRFGHDREFDRVADVVFAYSQPYTRAWVGYREHLPWHDAPNRMYLQPDHYLVRQIARDRVKELIPDGLTASDARSD